MKIYFHRDFDGMAAAAILADALAQSRGHDDVNWEGVNFDRTLEWENFALGEEFAVVDFHYHPRAAYWFDHHPTTFLDDQHKEAYVDSDTHCFDPTSPSCPPIILKHAKEHWGYQPPEHFIELEKWSNIIDAAGYDSAEHALFGTEPAMIVSRALTCSPNLQFHDTVVQLMRDKPLSEIAQHPIIEKCYKRSSKNRDNAIENFEANVLLDNGTALLADLRSKKIRRDRFAPFYLHPEIYFCVNLLPTRAGDHITVSSNPWNRPKTDFNLGELMKKYKGGGHKSVGGCNPPNSVTAMKWAREIYDIVKDLK
ncbi:MAG: hypothetical protein ACI84O_001377 [Myxococcota bacterium]|jgi:hypothetical protein